MIYAIMATVFALGVSLAIAGFLALLLVGGYGADMCGSVIILGAIMTMASGVYLAEEVNSFDFDKTYEFNHGEKMYWGGKYLGTIDEGLIFLDGGNTQMYPIEIKVITNIGYKEFEIIEIKKSSISIKYERGGII